MGTFGEYGIDDITWNDLDMDVFFFEFNNTCSQNGGEYLYDMLRRPLITEEGLNTLKERGRVAGLFQKDHELRKRYEDAFKVREEIRKGKVREKIEELKFIRDDSNFLHMFAFLLGLLSLCLIFINPPAGFAVFFIAAVFNVSTYFKRKAEIDEYIPVIRNLIREIRETGVLLKIKAQGLESYNGRLSSIRRELKSVVRNSWIIAWGKRLTGGILDLPLDFIRIFFHPDLIKFNMILKTVREKEKEVRELYDITGFLDSMISLSVYRERMPYYTEPVFKEDDGIEIVKGYHPLIRKPVPFTVDKVSHMLLTGSNASGKSTFLKSTALAIILSETVFTAPAESIRLAPSEVLSSMSLRDNIMAGESLYVTEIKSVKRIVEKTAGGSRTAVFLDEVLKGTNTVERIASLSVLLKSFKKAGLCFAATHDTPLTEILDGIYDNYHFDETVTENGISFPYELKKGSTDSKDAIKLLSLMGFSDEITKEAFSMGDKYEKEGIWEKL